jgi:3'-5' exoribonuclease
VHSQFAVSQKSLREYTRGKYLSLRLADRTGKISAVMWDNAEAAAYGLAEGDLVEVKGQVTIYNNEKQITLSSLKKIVDVSVCSPADFLPIAPIPVEELIQEFDEILSQINDEDYCTLLQTFRHDDEIWDKFTLAPGAKRWHHPYLHGLLHHTLTVVNECRFIAQHYPRIDRDLLTAGAIFHDIGKTIEFEYQFSFDYSTVGRLLGHVYIGANLVEKWMDGIPGFPEDKRNRLIHMILSHHGETERSPILPMTMEAELLHHIENMDAQLTAYERELSKADAGQMEWTPFVKLIDRFLYHGKDFSLPETTIELDEPF